MQGLIAIEADWMVTKVGQQATALTRQLLAFSRQQVVEPQVLNLNNDYVNPGMGN